MIQEYLILTDERLDEIKKYKPENTTTSFTKIKGTDSWLIRYAVKGEGRSAAETLSDVNGYIIEQYNPVVLTNESAAYFNRALYPCINTFERKLRKLLYIKSVINKGDKVTENIKDLESKDFGKIFELLFSDGSFVKEAKSKVTKEMTWQFSKRQLLETIEKLSEDTLYDHIFANNQLSILNAKYDQAIGYRNDVMHAHNIDKKTYGAIKRLFVKMNKQIDTEIEEMLKPNPPSPQTPQYNTLLYKAIKEIDYNALAEQVKKWETIFTGFSEYLAKFTMEERKQYLDSIERFSTYLSEQHYSIEKTAAVVPEFVDKKFGTNNPIEDNNGTDEV